MKQHNPLERNWQRCACGKRGWMNRKAARAARRKTSTSDALSVYACPQSSLFHLGHLPPQVTDGRWSRSQLGRSATRRPDRGRGAA